jgi:hypothetical protein
LEICLGRASGKPLHLTVAGFEYPDLPFHPFEKEIKEISVSELSWLDDAFTELLSEIRIMATDKTAQRILQGELALAQISAQANRSNNGAGETAAKHAAE